MGRKRIFFGTKAEYNKQYKATSKEYRQALKERRKRPEEKKYTKEYLKRPEVVERYREAKNRRMRFYSSGLTKELFEIAELSRKLKLCISDAEHRDAT